MDLEQHPHHPTVMPPPLTNYPEHNDPKGSDVTSSTIQHRSDWSEVRPFTFSTAEFDARAAALCIASIDLQRFLKKRIIHLAHSLLLCQDLQSHADVSVEGSREQPGGSG